MPSAPEIRPAESDCPGWIAWPGAASPGGRYVPRGDGGDPMVSCGAYSSGGFVHAGGARKWMRPGERILGGRAQHDLGHVESVRIRGANQNDRGAHDPDPPAERRDAVPCGITHVALEIGGGWGDGEPLHVREDPRRVGV